MKTPNPIPIPQEVSQIKLLLYGTQNPKTIKNEVETTDTIMSNNLERFSSVDRNTSGTHQHAAVTRKDNLSFCSYLEYCIWENRKDQAIAMWSINAGKELANATKTM
jgi:hypothetical protein